MGQIYCTKCGKANSDDSVFCTACGARLSKPMNTAPMPPAYQAQTYSQQPAATKKNSLAPIIALVAVILIALIALVLFLLKPWASGPSADASSSAAAIASSASAPAATASSDAASASASAGSSQSSAAAQSSSSAAVQAKSEYVLPDSDSRYYSRSELSKLSNEELYYARNEIYARHGRGFKKQDLRDYFNSKSWYVERYSPEEFDNMASPLNDYERKNAELMLDIEKSRNSSYL